MCSLHNCKGVNYNAIIIEWGEIFVKDHNHHFGQAQPSIANTIATQKKIKKAALSDTFTSAADIMIKS